MFDFTLVFPEGPKDVADVVLRHGPQERNALTGVFLEGRPEGLEGLPEALRTVFPFAQNRKGSPEIVLCRRPRERIAVVGVFLKCSLKCIHGLLEVLRSALSLTQGRKGIA